jgi:MFS family permease
MQIIGMGTVVMLPLIGNLSDQYGRKALLTLPMTLSIIPLGNHMLYT